MFTRLLLLGLLALSAFSQSPPPPDCSIFFSFTAAGSTSSFDNRSRGCVTWTLLYQSSGFSGLTLTFQSASGSLTAGSFGTYGGTVATGSNPNTSTTGAITTFTNGTVVTPWLRVTLSGLTGSGEVNGVVYGYKTGYARSSGGGAVASVSAGASGALICSPTTGAVVCDADPTVVPLLAQSNTWVGANDFTGAASTAPAKSGTSLPATCAVGQQFFKTNATNTNVLYGCTATNTWTAQGGGSAPTGGSYIGVTAGAVSLNPFDFSAFIITDRFCGSSNVGGPTFDVGQLRWSSAALAGVSTLTLAGDVNHPCYWQVVTGAVSGDGTSVYPFVFTSQPQLGFAYGNAANWEVRLVIQINTIASANFGFGFGATPAQDITGAGSSNLFHVRKLSTDATFVFECCDASFNCSETNSTVTPTDATSYTLRMRSAVAGTILFSVNGETEVSKSTDVPTATLYPVASIKTATTGTRQLRMMGFGFAKTSLTP